MDPVEPSAVPRRAWVGLGSNLGERIDYLRQAVAALEDAGVRVVEASSVYETEPVGGPTQPPYLNAVVELLWRGDPRQLLEIIRTIEADADRVRDEHWGPRTLDLDIIAVDGVEIEATDDSEALVLPHPRAHERAFVLVPLAEVAPFAVLPPHGTAAEVLAGLDASLLDGVRRTSFTLRP